MISYRQTIFFQAQSTNHLKSDLQNKYEIWNKQFNYLYLNWQIIECYWELFNNFKICSPFTVTIGQDHCRFWLNSSSHWLSLQEVWMLKIVHNVISSAILAHFTITPKKWSNIQSTIFQTFFPQSTTKMLGQIYNLQKS